VSPESKQKIQLVLALTILTVGARTAYILYERHASKIDQAQQQAPPLNPDYYVTPRRLYPYDLKSARQLTQQPVWVKEGYRYTYYPYENHHTDFTHEAGQLLPIERLQIKDVVTDATPGSPGQRQVLAVFEDGGKDYAVPVGSVRGGEYQIYSDEMLYIQDPHDLYKHWSTDIWQAIDQHRVKPGMNELQVDFAIGMGIPERSGDPDTKTVNYPHGGNPVRVTYQDGKAAEIQ